ncbi:HAMP domain-containing protein [Duganella sp. FT92W]|uniref:HAMP domain-containing protein n=1 Tax=Pseudoduganella rivuli TaxID=2666085 RepID=A0A7X2LWX5_9BURK|nr:methyl-accepting chemotaxis protein [Pseudoduganella rivuli]MRV75602.1 HAMP domain-containing protein [Pseudoduganella rivuli]
MKNLKIGMRLGIAFAVVLSLLALLTVIGIVRMQSASEKTNILVADDVRIERMIAEWQKVVEVNAARTSAAWKVQDPADQKYFEQMMAASSARATEIQDAMPALLPDAEGKAMYEAILASRKAYVDARKAVFKAKADSDLETGKRLFESDMEGKRIVYLAALQKLSDEQRRRLDRMAADIQASYESGRNMLLMLGIAAVALGVGFAWYITRTITQPISDAVRVAESVSSGDLTSDIVVQTRDEAGQLMHALKSMNSNLVDIVGLVRTGADNMADATSEIAAGNLDLSNRTERQASSLQETASSMEHLTSIVRANAENARQASALADMASQTASRGGAVVGDMVHMMDAINASSRRIVDIIAVIDGIAFQTNILALNAAVEAARAGEQGRGFAVVASEVRGLAQRSAGAAKEIKELIAESVEKVDAGTSLTSTAGQTMDEIVAAIARVTAIMTDIAEASEAQRTGIEQINQAITQMDQTTQQNAALVEQAAAAASAMQQQSEQLAQSVSVFKLTAQQIAAMRAGMRSAGNLPALA